MTKIKTVYFDWGGVVATDPGDEFLDQILTDIGASRAQIDEIYHSSMRQFMSGEISEQQYWQALRDRYNFVIEETISQRFFELGGLNANKDIMKLISEVKEKGFKVGLLTNVIEPSYNALKQMGRYEVFDSVTASCIVGSNKPDKTIYDIALKSLDTEASEALFIDDKERNLAPARIMGMTTILAKNPEQIIEDTYKALPQLNG